MDNPRCKTVTIYDWPWSQKCMDCKFGEFFQSDTFDTSNMLCHIARTDNDGQSCGGFIERTDNPGEEE
jgi:hypothetical protein